MTLDVTVHHGELRRYEVRIQGPRVLHEMTVFATGFDDAAAAAVEKIQDKIRRHNYRGWGPIRGPWTVVSILAE